MTKQTYTKRIRQHYAKDGKTLPPLPSKEQLCLGCKKSMMVPDGTISKFHKECKKIYKHKMKFANVNI